MMTEIKPYILSVIAVAMISSIVNMIYPKNGASGQLIKTISGMLLLLTIASPFLNQSHLDSSYWLDSFSGDAANAAQAGEEQMRIAIRDSIKQRAQAYILDKAADYGAQINVEIGLSNDDIPIPISAVIVGDVSPYAKTQLQYILQKDLGIAAREQIWK